MAYDTVRKDTNRYPFSFLEIEVDGQVTRVCEDQQVPAGLDAFQSMQAGAWRISPAEIDLEGGLGLRASLSVSFSESMDYNIYGTITDPVRYWARWRAENPYYRGGRISLFTGYIVDGIYDVTNFQQRDYVIESFSQTAGKISFTGKDPLKNADNDRAKAPFENAGELSADINDTVNVFVLSPAGIGNLEYDSSGWARINDEVMSFTRTNDSMTVVRAQYNTVSTSHAANDKVQQCLVYDLDTVSDITYDLLTNYGEVDASYINKTEWDAESDSAFSTRYSTIITEPTGVNDLIQEFAQTAPHYVYYDDRSNLIRFVALKEPPQDALNLSYEENLIANSVGVSDQQDMRISTVICNYGQFNPTVVLDDVTNYARTYIRVDPDSVTNYGTPKYKTIYSRWINQDNKSAAVLMTARVGRRFSDAPRMISFTLDAKDIDVWTGDPCNVQTDLIVQSGGGFPFLPYQILSAQESKNNFQFKALEHTYGPAVPGDEDAEDPLVRLVYINGDNDRLNNRNLRELYEDVFGLDPLDPDYDIRFIFETSSVSGSSVQSDSAVETGTWPELNTPILIDCRGLIAGYGGRGASINGSPENGGVALELDDDIRLNNTGIIGGGGPGGDWDLFIDPEVGNVERAGGGGAGFTNGIAGAGTNAGDGSPVDQAQNGTNTTGGRGGGILPDYGESGGDLGVDTTSATAGNAIVLNGNTITYINAGDIRGTIS